MTVRGITVALDSQHGLPQAPLALPRSTFITSATTAPSTISPLPTIPASPLDGGFEPLDTHRDGYTVTDGPLYTTGVPNIQAQALHHPNIKDEALEERYGKQESAHTFEAVDVKGRPSIDSSDEPLESVPMKGRLAHAIASMVVGWISSFHLWQMQISPFSRVRDIPGKEQCTSGPGSWLDQKVCEWMGVCGNEDWYFATTEGKTRPEDWADDGRVLTDIPQYVLDHAPLVHLFSGEQFWPGDIAEHLDHITPYLNYTPLQARSEHPTLQNLDELNQWDRGRFVYLTSNDNVEERPDWLGGEKNIPTSPSSDQYENFWASREGRMDRELALDHKQGKENDRWSDAGGDRTTEKRNGRSMKSRNIETPADSVNNEQTSEGDDGLFAQRHGKTVEGGRSNAPAILIVVNKGKGIVDAFWFYFYSFNLGNVVFNVRFGNHVGDWEHSLVRFQHGKPKAVFLSEHNFGEAYAYEALEKMGKRVSTYPAMPVWKSSRERTNRLTTNRYIARNLLRNRNARNVRNARLATLRATLGPATRPNRPRPTMGSAPQLPHLHVRLPERHPPRFQPHPHSAY